MSEVSVYCLTFSNTYEKSYESVAETYASLYASQYCVLWHKTSPSAVNVKDLSCFSGSWVWLFDIVSGLEAVSEFVVSPITFK